MDIKFKKVRMPLYCLLAVILLLAGLAYASKGVVYNRTDVIDGDSVSVQNTLFQYLYEQITGSP